MRVQGPGAAQIAPLLERWARAARVGTTRTLVYTRLPKRRRRALGLCYMDSTRYQGRQANGAICLGVDRHRTLGGLAHTWLHELGHLRDGVRIRNGNPNRRRPWGIERRAEMFARRMTWRVAFTPPPEGWLAPPPLEDPPAPQRPPPSRSELALASLQDAEKRLKEWETRAKRAQTLVRRWQRRVRARRRALAQVQDLSGGRKKIPGLCPGRVLAKCVVSGEVVPVSSPGPVGHSATGALRGREFDGHPGDLGLRGKQDWLAPCESGGDWVTHLRRAEEFKY